MCVCARTRMRVGEGVPCLEDMYIHVFACHFTSRIPPQALPPIRSQTANSTSEEFYEDWKKK